MPSPQYDNLVATFRAQRAGGPMEPVISDLRRGFDLLGQMMPPVDGVDVSELEMAGLPASRVSPDGASDDRALLYLHGGGYCIGSRVSHAPLVANLAKAASVTAFLPEYRLAPEAPFPAALDDAVAAYRWLLEQGYAPQRVAVAGESAGGGLAAALLLRARDEGFPLPSSATLISPWCDLVEVGEVLPEALDADFLRPEQLDVFVASYAPDEATRSDPLCSPGRADLSGLPPLLIQVGEHEILCGMGCRLAQAAKDAGVDVTLEVEPRMFHAGPLFAGVLPEADEAISRIAAFANARFS